MVLFHTLFKGSKLLGKNIKYVRENIPLCFSHYLLNNRRTCDKQ